MSNLSGYAPCGYNRGMQRFKFFHVFSIWSVLFCIGVSGCTEPITPTATSVAEAAETAVPLPNTTPARPTSIPSTYRFETVQLGSVTIEYAIVTPGGFYSQREYPILLALPPGEQTKEMVEVGLNVYWAEEAKTRGWIVISPVAPDGVLFFQGSESLIPDFLARTAEIYHPIGDKYYLAGVSNGGISAFRLALNSPQLFRSLLVLPGFPQSTEDKTNLVELVDIPVAMFVGEQDTAWLGAMQETETTLQAAGGNVTLNVLPGEGHILESVTGEMLYEWMESQP